MNEKAREIANFSNFSGKVYSNIFLIQSYILYLSFLYAIWESLLTCQPSLILIPRHINFPIGTRVEQEVIAAASCCTERMKLTVKDVAGEKRELVAVWNETQSGLSKVAFWSIIGAAIAVVLIIAIIITVICCKKRYARVSTGH